MYRGDALPQRSFKTLLLYVSLFHQCIAGPIVRYKDVCAELENRRATQIEIAEGINRFTVGLAKKAIIANTCAALADTLLVPDGGDFSLLASKSALSLWVGVLAFTLQIYIDFSAYSDMAIGMGKMIGIHYTENFDYPYISSSVSEFWRRWHITSAAFSGIIFISRSAAAAAAKLRTVLNLFIVWALTGLWHGAPGILCFGDFISIFIALEKLFLSKYLEKQPALAHIYLLLIVFSAGYFSSLKAWRYMVRA
ncbi:MAG: MBOAT family O-acyltransferase [Oscillospiraceae bacterium]